MKIIAGLFFFLAMQVSVLAQTHYQMAGPYEVIARDGKYAYTKKGSEDDMHMALELAQRGDSTQALHIINAYASKLQSLEGHDAPLCLIQCCDMVQAMMLLRSHQRVEWKNMLQRAILPVIEQFEADSPYANGNWGTSCMLLTTVRYPDTSARADSVRKQVVTKPMCNWDCRLWQRRARWHGVRAMTFGEHWITGC